MTGRTAGTSDGTGNNYLGVQALRAVAAALVVLHHSIMMWLAWIVHRPTAPHWRNGASGVDIFFTISGFVMAISAPGLAGKANKAGLFLSRRFTRIVPLYWGATTAKIAILKLWPSAALNPVGTPWRILASYLFIPANNGKGEMYPVLDVGWTLSYEVFFYLLFSAALALDLYPLAFLAPCLTAVGLVAMLRPATWPDFTILASTMVIEFLYGVILAHLVTRKKLPGSRVGMLLLAGGFAALMLIPQAPPNWKFLAWGLPAAAVVTGAVALERKYGARLPKWLLEAGDASYALYLVHTFIMPFLGNILGRLRLPGTVSLAAAIVLGLGISFPVSLLVHRWVEKPLMSLFKKRPKPATEAGAPLAIAEGSSA
jgi:peptidoglycan/LPS O-acetylase OafA/YrhL